MLNEDRLLSIMEKSADLAQVLVERLTTLEGEVTQLRRKIDELNKEKEPKIPGEPTIGDPWARPVYPHIPTWVTQPQPAHQPYYTTCSTTINGGTTK